MFFTILRIALISYLTYLVLNESGINTAILVYLIMMMLEFIKWNMRDTHKHHLSELRKMKLRIETLESIVQPSLDVKWFGAVPDE